MVTPIYKKEEVGSHFLFCILLTRNIDINDLLGKSACALAADFVDVFRHTATTGVQKDKVG